MPSILWSERMLGYQKGSDMNVQPQVKACDKPRKTSLTRPQREALQLLSDEPREARGISGGRFIGGSTAQSLVRLGYAERRSRGYQIFYVITEAGEKALKALGQIDHETD